MRSRAGRSLTFVTLTALLTGSSALGQTPNGRISGVVRDSLRVPREAATVRVTNDATGATRSAITRADGSYAIPGLTPGVYTVYASMIGFKRTTRANVQVQGDVTVDLVLVPVALQAVTVTATLREEELYDVPFSVAAPTAKDLRDRGAGNIEEVAANVAGFSVQNLGPGQSQVAIRGASAGQIARDQPGVKEQAGVYLDDVPISLSLFTPDLDLFDVSRVEVLRGPQGTLFGSGSLSGTVRYITNQPELGIRRTFGELSSSQVLAGGGFGAGVKLGSNTPIGDKAAARVALYYNQLPGFMDAVQPNERIDKNVNGGSRTGVRAAFRWVPNDRFTITPRVVYQTVRMDGWNRNDAFNILGNPYTTTRPAVTLGPRELYTQIPEPFTDNYTLGDVEMLYDFGKVNLTSITSYSYRDILVVRDAGALTSSITGGSIGLPEKIYTLNAPLNDATKTHTVTQEVRLAGGGTRFRWLAGGFFAKAIRGYGQELLVSGFEAASGIPTKGLRAPKDVLFYSDLSYDLKQSALFGEATVNLTDQLELTGGIRYYNFDEDRQQIFDGIFAQDSTGTALVSTPGKTSADGFAPRFMLSYKATSNLTLNAQASRGFRLGGINDPLNVPLCTSQDLATFSGRDSWTDETAWNYEVGAKARLMGGRGSLNASVFYMDIKDLQLVVTAGSCSSRLVFNTPKSVSQGAEIEFTASPNRNFDFSLSGMFNQSELRSTLTSTSSGGQVSVVSGIEDGNRLPSVPEVQIAAAVTLHQPIRSGMQGFFTTSYNHIGSRFTQIDDEATGFGTVDLNSFGKNTIGAPLTQSTFTFSGELPAYDLVNARIGVSRVNWEAALYLNNITDERALLALDRERGTRARVGYLTNQPRTLGVSITFNY